MEKYDFKEWEKRAIEVTKAKNPSDLSRKLGFLKPTIYFVRKHNNSIPYKELVKYCVENDVDIREFFKSE